MAITRKVLNWYARMAPARGRVNPPYAHVVQIGDPTLRKISQPVPLEKINTEEIQKVVQRLGYVINKYGSVGMSAPQIGVNLRIFVMMHTAKQISAFPKEFVSLHGMTVIPYSVFINPKMKVTDYQKVILSEGCESVRGFQAEVARYRGVEVTGYNAEGKQITTQFRDWPARIAQHEFDHLDGKLYTDNMDRKTLECTCWDEVNLSQGRVVLPFTPE